MGRTEIVFAVGGVIAAIGAFLTIRAGALAATWQRTESGNGWGGITDPALRNTYSTIGLIGRCVGPALVGLAAWGRPAAGRPRVSP